MNETITIDSVIAFASIVDEIEITLGASTQRRNCSKLAQTKSRLRQSPSVEHEQPTVPKHLGSDEPFGSETFGTLCIAQQFE
jgi:hypothetical protein